jgi:spore germination cell wall hydrolase CwlJ-like protein
MSRTAGNSFAALLIVCIGASGCTTTTSTDVKIPFATAYALPLQQVDPKAKDCLARAMYFESRRGDESGLLAVGTVVMNRVESGKYPDSVCGVVGQKGQFARGVLTKPMTKDREKVEAVAERVLKGERYAKAGTAKHFHMAGMKFGYRNMRYTCVAGGNAFYEKLERIRKG